MTIETGVATSLRVPGTFFVFNEANANRGLTPLDKRIALIGIQSSAATATAETVNEIFSAADADALFGAGSELALMAKIAIQATREQGSAAALFGVGIAAPAGVAATFTLTVTGTATEAGEVVFKLAGRVIRAAVANGDANTVVSVAMKDAIDEQQNNLPLTAGEAAGVVTTTHVTTGVNGNDLAVEVVSTPAGISVVAAAGVAGTGVADITASLDVLADKDYDFVAIANHAAADVADFTTHLDEMFDAGTKRWRHGIMAETGTLGTAQALATAADDFRQIVVSAEGFPNLPSEVAAYVASTLGGESDPAKPWNNVELPSLALPAAADVPTNTELQSGISGGLFMLSVNEQQSRAKIVRAVTTQTTLASVPFFSLLDVTISTSMFFVARQCDIAIRQNFQRAKKTARTKREIRDIVLEKLFAIEEIEIVQNVEANAGELQVEDDATNPDRVNVAIPTSIVPPLNQVAAVINLIVE